MSVTLMAGLHHTDWCDHQAFCPEKGGVLLPWPDVVPDPAAPEQRHVDAAARAELLASESA